MVASSSDAGTRKLARSLAAALILAALLVASLATMLIVAGYPVSPAFGALWTGSFGSGYALGSATLVRATPLLLTGLAVTLAFRAGIWNIGAEGQLLAGASAVTALALAVPRTPLPLVIPMMIGAGALAGALWAAIAAELKRRYGVLEVISTIMLNFIAIYLVGYLVRGPLQEPLHIYPQSAAIPVSWRLNPLWQGTRLTLAFVLALAAAVSIWSALKSTSWGFRVRAMGANPEAARSAGGIDVPALSFRVFLLSGAIAGLAGMFEVLGVTGALYENLSPGYGYSAIAVALLARLNPILVIPSAILFGALEAGAAAMQRDAGIPSVIVWIVEAMLLLGILIIDRMRPEIALGALRMGDGESRA